MANSHQTLTYGMSGTIEVSGEARQAILALSGPSERWKRLTAFGREEMEPLFLIENDSEPGRLSLKVGPYVGILRAGNVEIAINPPTWLKNLSSRHLLFMLLVAYSQSPSHEVIQECPTETLYSWSGLVEPLHGVFVSEIASALHRGTYREYVASHQLSSCLKGRIDWASQATLIAKGMPRFSTTVEQLTSENRVNAQLARACRAVENQTQNNSHHADAYRIRRQLGKQDLSLERSRAIPRRASHLTRSLEVASVILADEGLSYIGDCMDITGIVVNLFDLFEKYLSSSLIGISDFYVPSFELALHASNTGWRQFAYPDIVRLESGEPTAVIDAKCKNIGQSGPRADDLYQVYTYACAMGLSHAFIVYPTQQTTPVERTYPVRLLCDRRIHISCYGLPITFDLDRENGRFAEAIRDLHESISRTVNLPIT